jgi:hypothetical protein
MSDALLLGGSVLDLLAAEAGDPVVVRLVSDPVPGTPERALERVFGRSVKHTEGAWRAHLAMLGGASS